MHPVNPVGLFVKRVVAELILNIHENQRTACKACRKPHDIQKRVPLVTSKRTEGAHEEGMEYACIHVDHFDLVVFFRSIL